MHQLRNTDPGTLPAQIIDKGISTSGLLAHVLVAKYSKHLPLYRQETINGITEAGCMAQARRKFFDLHVSNKSQIAEQALKYISQLYDVEREVKHLRADERRQIRQAQSKPFADAFH